MALGSHLITVRRLKKYIDDVIGKKANLPDTSKTIIGNISKINTDLSVKTGFPDYANQMSFTSGTTSWTATEDVYIEYILTSTDNTDSRHLFVDNVKVSVADSRNANTWIQSFNGYIKAGSVINCIYLAVTDRFRVFPLL